MRHRDSPILRFLLTALAAALLPSCGGSVPEPEKAARAFVEAYYVRADLTAVGRLAAGLAGEKIARQTRLRKSPRDIDSVQGVSPGLTNRRNVEFEILEVRDRENGRKVFRFGLSISNPSVTLRLQTLVTVGKGAKGEKGRWIVLNFLDINPPPTRGSGNPSRSIRVSMGIPDRALRRETRG